MKALIFLALLAGFDENFEARLKDIPAIQSIPHASVATTLFKDSTIQAWWQDSEGVHIVVGLNQKTDAQLKKWKAWLSPGNKPWVQYFVDEWTVEFWQAHDWRSQTYRSLNDWETCWDSGISRIKAPIAQNFGVGKPLEAKGLIGDSELFAGPPKSKFNDAEQIKIEPKINVGLDSNLIAFACFCGAVVLTAVTGTILFVTRRKK